MRDKKKQKKNNAIDDIDKEKSLMTGNTTNTIF